MIEILNNHCNDKNGLLLFNPPTGSGKTHTVLKWIYENYEDYCKGGKKIFFITNLKKNLPYEELRENFFLPQGKEEQFDKHVTFLDSNSEELIKNFLKTKDSVNDYFKKTTIFYNLNRNLSEINKHKDNQDLKPYVDKLKDDLRKDLEPKFRRSLEKHLKENFRNKQERIKAIKYDDEYKWIGELYPAVFTSKKKVFFLSIDKFYFKNSTLVEPSYSFLENDITKNAIIFIDEFDATKDSLLGHIIEKGLQRHIDFIHLFTEIYWALSKNILPQKFITHSEQREELLKKNEKNDFLKLENIQIRLLNKAQEIVDKYKTDYSFKTTNNNQEDTNQRNLLFHDFHYHTVYKNDKKFIRLNTNQKDKVNEIIFETDRPDKNEKNIVSLLNQIRGFINFFSSIIKSIAENYQQLETQERSSSSRKSEFTFDLALSTVIEEFSLESKYKNYIIENILSARERPRNKPNELNYDFSFYENGFRYYDFVDDDLHQSKTKTFIYNFQNTPEKFILKLAEKSKVIGISATALIKTVTGNYDIRYFKRQLGNNFIELSKEEKNILYDLFNKQNENYNKVKIHTEWVSFISDEDREHIVSEFEKLFENKELAEEIYGLTLKINNGTNGYLFNRYLKIGHCFKEFLLKDDIKGFLCLLNKEPTYHSKDLHLKVLNQIFQFLIKDVTKSEKHFLNKNDEFKVTKSYIIINSHDYENKKQLFIDRLEKGQKIFIISMYQTMGAGQNLQYISPNPKELINVRSKDLIDWNKNKQTDINAIYLDKPTHIIQRIDKNLKEVGFVKYLFQLEFLLQAGIISVVDLNNQVTSAFKHLLASFNSTNKIPSPNNNHLYKDENIKQHFAKYIIQAIGRICRTNLKSSNIYIYADSELDEKISDFDVENKIVLKEFKALVKSSNKRIENKKHKDEKLKKLAILANTRVNTYIKKFINQDWNWKPKQVEEWNNLRTMCLCLPTLSKDDVNKLNLNRILDLYIEQPTENNQYSYSQKEDYEQVEVSFNNDLPQQVSEKSARLDELLEINGVYNLFEKNKWATTFNSKQFILSPTLFNNIYKGTLGEQIGKFIFEKHFKIELEELSIEHYELFDYKIKGTNTYIDFKHWKESTKISYDEQITKILGKAETVNAEKIFIINILSSAQQHLLKTANQKIVEVPYLWNSEIREFNYNLLEEINETV